jgi:Mrp family chromosome partitioning ATPase/uncharacterized protein involved in exopolysaccharide biosynthesis
VKSDNDNPIVKQASTEVIEVVPPANELSKPANPFATAHSLLRGRYRLAICLAAIGAVIGALGGYFLMKPEYRSVGIIRYYPIGEVVLKRTEENSPMSNFEGFLASQVAQLRDRRVTGPAMLRPEWKALGRGMLPDAVADFEESLEVVNPRSSPLIQVTFSDRDPQAAAIAVKAVIETYEQLYGNLESASGQPKILKLQTRRAELASQLTGINDNILLIANDFGSASLQQVYDFKLSELNKVEAQLRYAHIQTLLAGANPQSTTAPTTTPAVQPDDQAFDLLVSRDSEVQHWQQEKINIERELNRLSRLYGDRYQKVLDARADLELATEKIRARSEELRKLIKAAPNSLAPVGGAMTLDQLRANERALQEVHDELKKETILLGRKNLTIEKLRAEADEVREQLAETKKRIDQLNVENVGSGRMSVMSYGDPPLVPDKDRRKALSAVGGLGLAGLGVGFVMLLGFMDRRLRHIDAARSRLHQIDRLLGVLPELSNDPADNEHSAEAAYCVNHIRAMLQIRQRTSGHRVLAVTSPSPGDGKTSLVVSLGMSFASSGCRTLVVDCDFDGGGLSSRLDNPGANDDDAPVRKKAQLGVVGALRGGALEAAIVETGYPMLSLLPLGAPTGSHVGQLSPTGLRRLLDRFESTFDTILIDCGPILGSVEAAVVCAEADGAVLLVSRGGDRTAAERAANLLVASGAEIEGIVFNRAHREDVARSAYHSSTSARSQRRTGSACPDAFANAEVPRDDEESL